MYGAAGTGKSTMVNYIANYFGSQRKLFLAHTNPAVDNLKRRVLAPNTHFSTITKHVQRRRKESDDFDIVLSMNVVRLAILLFLKYLTILILSYWC
ncbi:hypothetical protein V5S96_03480 [Corynebacterium mastitidis]|uniref:Uncharacterized protein n=1 Tax=Corynebacterium mastitidis TaxID=161890 RepID=A0ABU8NWQ2_9CORY